MSLTLKRRPQPLFFSFCRLPPATKRSPNHHKAATFHHPNTTRHLANTPPAIPHQPSSFPTSNHQQRSHLCPTLIPASRQQLHHHIIIFPCAHHRTIIPPSAPYREPSSATATASRALFRVFAALPRAITTPRSYLCVCSTTPTPNRSLDHPRPHQIGIQSHWFREFSVSLIQAQVSIFFHSIIAE